MSLSPVDVNLVVYLGLCVGVVHEVVCGVVRGVVHRVVRGRVSVFSTFPKFTPHWTVALAKPLYHDSFRLP